MPRMFGYGFNPLSIYFCYRRDGSLAAILYEVHNTFGERHSYLIPVEPSAGDGRRSRCCDKSFYVSPFMDMDMSYAFRVAAPGGTRQRSRSAQPTTMGSYVAAALIGAARGLDRRSAAARPGCAYPLLTLKVIAAIHWHALRMWLKGFRLRPRARAARPIPSRSCSGGGLAAMNLWSSPSWTRPRARAQQPGTAQVRLAA